MTKIVHAQLKVRIGGYKKFCESMATFVPVQESAGWKLRGAYCTRVGRVFNVVHIWEIPDANAFFDAVENMVKSPVYASWSAGLAETVEEENIAMCIKTPYCP